MPNEAACLDSVLVSLAGLPAAEAADAARADQDWRWRSGDRVPAETYLDRLPAVAADPEHALVVIYGEVLCRAARGERPDLREYQLRFPGLADRLAVQFALHEALAVAGSTPSPTGSYGPSAATVTATVTRAAPAPDEVPERIGPYRVMGVLGRGGMGIVYRAEDVRLGRAVAVKVIRPPAGIENADRSGRTPVEVYERFLREARAAAAVKHDHIVTVYHADEVDGIPFLAMELLDGTSLDRWLEGRPRPSLTEAVRIARQTADALAAAHARGIVHRDVKPSNLWLEAPHGRVKVLDFGLARPVAVPVEVAAPDQDPGGATHTRAVAGTPGYMAPEQARGEPVDARADLFALGCVLYRLVTGRQAFVGTSVRQLLAAVENDTPLAVQGLNPAAPRALAALIERCLAKVPADRPESAAVVASELRAIAVAIASPVVRTRRARRAAAGLAIVAVAAVGVAYAVRSGAPATPDQSRGDRPAIPEPADSGVKPPVPGVAPPIDLAARPRRSLAALDRSTIPPEESFPWQPAELVAVLGAHARKHWGAVTGLGIDPAGRIAVSAGEDGILRVYDAVTMEVRAEVLAHPRGCIGLSTAAGGRVATLGTLEGVTVWDLSSGVPKPAGRVQHLGAGSVALSPAGTRLAIGRTDGIVSIHDVRGASPLPVVSSVQATPKGVPVRLAFVRGGEWLLTAGTDGTVRTWDAMTGADLGPLTKHPFPAGISASSDGLTAVTVDTRGLVRVWDLSGAKPDMKLELTPAQTDSQAVGGPVLAPDGTRLALREPGTVSVWNLTRQGEKPAFRIPVPGTGPVAFGPGGRTLLAGHATDPFSLWDLTGSGARQAIPDPPDATVIPLAVTPAGELLAARSRGGGWYDLTGPAPRFGPPVDWVPRSASPRQFVTTWDGRRLVFASEEIAEFEWGGNGWGVTRTTPAEKSVLSVGLSADGATMATVEPFGSLRVWRMKEGRWQVWRSLTVAHAAADKVRLSPDGGRLVEFGLKVWDLTADPPRSEPLLPGRSAGTTWDLSADGRVLVAWVGPELRVWDCVDHTFRPRPPVPDVPAPSFGVVAASPTGTRVATGGQGLNLDRRFTLTLRDLTTGAPAKSWSFPGRLTDVRFTPDDRHLITTNSNGTAYVLRLDGPPGGAVRLRPRAGVLAWMK